MTCRYLHRSLKLSYGAKEWGILLCILMTQSTQLWPGKWQKMYYVLLKVKTIAIQISLTHSYWLVGIINHFYWECEVLQIVSKETECFKFIEGDALTKTKNTDTILQDILKYTNGIIIMLQDATNAQGLYFVNKDISASWWFYHKWQFQQVDRFQSPLNQQLKLFDSKGPPMFQHNIHSIRVWLL